MKKSINSLFVVLLLCINLFSATAFAVDSTTEKIYYNDGSFATITTFVSRNARGIVADNKTYTYYNPSLDKCFSYTIYATFSYSGATSAAETIDYDIDIYHPDWDVDSHDEYIVRNQAFGNASFSGPNGVTRNVSLTLTCDANGNVK